MFLVVTTWLRRDPHCLVCPDRRCLQVTHKKTASPGEMQMSCRYFSKQETLSQSNINYRKRTSKYIFTFQSRPNLFTSVDNSDLLVGKLWTCLRRHWPTHCFQVTSLSSHLQQYGLLRIAGVSFTTHNKQHTKLQLFRRNPETPQLSIVSRAALSLWELKFPFNSVREPHASAPVSNRRLHSLTLTILSGNK